MNRDSSATLPAVTHQAIKASAGSGKTFKLAHRYIRLLSLGVEPDRIAALTFSRKAAGEIFDSIVSWLCRASADEDGASAVAERIEHPGMSPEAFRPLLRGVLDAMPRLQVGTLDSFAVSIVRAFPFELGVALEFEVMDTDGATALGARQEVLRSILESRDLSLRVQEEFLEAFKQATFGREQKGLGRTLDEFIQGFHAIYRTVPEANAWGDESVIWPSGSPWLFPVKAVEEAAGHLRATVEAAGWDEKIGVRWGDFIDLAAAHRPGSDFRKPLEYLMKKLLPEVEGLRDGAAEVSLERKTCALEGEGCAACLQLVSHVMWCEIRAALETTKGIYRVMQRFDEGYEAQVRRRGRLTFEDVQFLLSGGNAASGGRRLSMVEDDPDRLFVDFRLDARLDHWLLDEFQDTSDLQWDVLQNLIDEVLQDTSGTRSLFYVGDVKQAIYRWRGGKAELFDRILERYGEAITLEPLNVSFRSCQAVIDCVNQVFSDLPEEAFAPATLSSWGKSWKPHAVAGSVPATGHAVLLSPAAGTDRHALAAGILREVDPVRRGLTAAVLVRKNKEGAEMVRILRAACPGLSVVHEGQSVITDNPVVAAFVSLLKVSAHPGDEFSWRHIGMTPLRRVMEEWGVTRVTITGKVLRLIHNHGFCGVVREWGQALQRLHGLDPFGRRRLEDLLAAAGEFDASGEREVGAFLRFLDKYTLRESVSSGAVRVMTIHQAKGLGFDLVILPELESRSILGVGEVSNVVARDPTTETPLWALNMPRQLVAEHDDVLSREFTADREERSLEALCVLYVALTRATQGLYLVTDRPPAKSTAYPAARFLHQQLESDGATDAPSVPSFGGEPFHVHYSRGEWEWYEGHAAEAPEEAAPTVSASSLEWLAGTARRQAAVPSAAEEGELPGGWFDAERAAGRTLGSAIHELFEHVKWSGTCEAGVVAASWMEERVWPDEISNEAAGRFREAMKEEAVREALVEPDGENELWRERAFSVVLDGDVVSGRFDRVVIEVDEGARAVAATVIDYKSDLFESEAQLEALMEKYRGQVELYGRAVARLVGIGEDAVALRLIFVCGGRVVKMESLT